MKNIWKSGIMGVVTGDALGCPVQFESRQEVAAHPVTGMRGFGAFHVPAGSWTDDSSLTLALLDSILQTGGIDLDHIMGNFVKWLDSGEFTPFGYSYDIGNGTMKSIRTYQKCKDPLRCAENGVWNNGNGSLMRILPACLYCWEKQLPDDKAIETIHQVASLTHAHLRSNIACGLYFFMVRAILDMEGPLRNRLQSGLDQGFAFYEKTLSDQKELAFYDRLRDLDALAKTPDSGIKSSGYVVDTLEAAVWSLLQRDTLEASLLTAVSLGEDTDTVAAIAGGLAGLFYGYDAIPRDWLQVLQRKAWIEALCDAADGNA